jgi:hypothetical protein
MEKQPASKMRIRIQGSLLAFIGFLLSPLSWWNDLFVNVPLAAAFAWMVSYFHPPAFEASLIVGYWLTNVAGLVLLHKGAKQVNAAVPVIYNGRELAKDVIVSLIYTGVIVGLIKLNFLAPLPQILGGH